MDIANQSINYQSTINQSTITMTFDDICDLVSHLENVGYNDSLGINPAIEFLKNRNYEITECLLAVAQEVIENNF